MLFRSKIGWNALMEAHWTARGNLTTRHEMEAYLRKEYEAHGLPTTVTTRDEAIEKLLYSKGGPNISCPPSLTIKSEGGRPVTFNYPPASASSRLICDKLLVTCSPAGGSEFPVGVTTVTCTAIDSNNRSDSCTVLMRVVP